MTVPVVSELRKRRLRALARAHHEFVVANLDAPFHPEEHPDGSDYNQHHVDLEAPDDAQLAFCERASAIMRGDLDEQLDDIILGTAGD